MSATALAVRQNKQRLIEQGIEQGYEIGAFQMALKIKRDLGLDVAVEISGFSRQELENGELVRLFPKEID
ncbi:hypothetical protein [uncultured Methanobrevibacter sp.]|uniref:hypothetical protein n=1 Tax=uncultured Methanobrevibacter sp. TaxID=253161 RepID=UPI00262A9293|nr:hypothetical protein [uncultured Methanobrevibacter sp.]